MLGQLPATLVLHNRQSLHPRQLWPHHTLEQPWPHHMLEQPWLHQSQLWAMVATALQWSAAVLWAQPLSAALFSELRSLHSERA